MIYANEKDVLRCMEITREELNKLNIVVKEDVLKEITIDIMNISYAKGGDYSNEIIRAFTVGYIDMKIYNKYI